MALRDGDSAWSIIPLLIDYDLWIACSTFDTWEVEFNEVFLQLHLHCLLVVDNINCLSAPQKTLSILPLAQNKKVYLLSTHINTTYRKIYTPRSLDLDEAGTLSSLSSFYFSNTHAKTPSSTFFSEEELSLRELSLSLSSLGFLEDDRADLLLLLDRLASPSLPLLVRLLLFDRLLDDLCLDEERFLDELRLERLALILRCIMARRLRRFVNRIPKNMNRLPMRHNVPRAYLALFATLKLAMVCPAEEKVLILPPEASEIRLVSEHREWSNAEHDLLEDMRAPAAE